MPETPPLLAIENLHKSYDDIVVLKGVSLQVREGDLVLRWTPEFVPGDKV